jgi:hypothetical protein
MIPVASWRRIEDDPCGTDHRRVVARRGQLHTTTQVKSIQGTTHRVAHRHPRLSVMLTALRRIVGQQQVLWRRGSASLAPARTHSAHDTA